jgi:hypothetical protein
MYKNKPKKNYDNNEYKIAEKLVGLKNKNIIDYDCLNEEKVDGIDYVALMLEYANSGVFYNLFLIYFFFILFYFFFFLFYCRLFPPFF